MFYTGQVKDMREYLKKIVDDRIVDNWSDEECEQYLKDNGYVFLVPLDEEGFPNSEEVYVYKADIEETILRR